MKLSAEAQVWTVPLLKSFHQIDRVKFSLMLHPVKCSAERSKREPEGEERARDWSQ